MPDRLAPPGRRRRAVDSDSDDHESTRNGRDGTPFSQASNSSKRVRLTTGRYGGERDHSETKDGILQDDEEINEGEDEEEEEEEEEEDPSPEAGSGDQDTSNETTPAAPPGAPNAASSSRVRDIGPLEHTPGSIVRVKLTNFVTYTSAECFPGPKLNMVIGPNGTGKSTFVCAICLGLGWGPTHLGRGKDVAEFVKQDTHEAIIEIELKASENMTRNPVITRNIKREGNKSAFTINGRAASQANVQTLAKSFSIQIDNLCQFLPQDKVSEFAALPPVELLHSTQRATAGPEMIQWHDCLKELRGEQKLLLEESASQKEHLAGLEKRQQMQREDVERMKKREEIKTRLKLLEALRPFPQYQQIRKDADAIKQERKKLIHEQEELKRQIEPVLKAVDSKKAYFSKMEAVLQQKRLVAAQEGQTAKVVSQRLTDIEERMKGLSDQIEAEKKGGSSQLDECKRVQQSINKLQRQIEENNSVEFDAAEYSEKIRDCTRQIREIMDKAREIQLKKKNTLQNLEINQRKVSDAEKRLEALKSQSGRQEDKLRQISTDSFNAWQWIKENQNRFEKQVYGPPIVECSVKDSRYTSALESLLQKNDFMAFTTQSRADFRTLQGVLYKELHLHDVSIKTCTVSLSSMTPPISDMEFQSYRFDGWAKDFISGPEPVLAMLCSENGFHRTGITLGEVPDDAFRALQESNKMNVWISGNTNYHVTRRREYGPGASSTKTRQLRPPKVWTNNPVGTSSTEEDLSNCITQWKQELSEISAKAEEERSALQRLKEQNDTITKDKEKLEKEKAEKQSAAVNFRSLPTKLAQQKEKLKTANSRTQAIREQVESLRDEQDELAIDKAAAAVEYSGAVISLRKVVEELACVEIMAIEAISDYETLKERNKNVTTSLDAKTAEVEDAIRRLDVIKPRVLEAAQKVRDTVTRMGSMPGLKEVGEEIKEYTPEELEAAIDSEKARLELTHEGSGNVIQEFEQRQQRIDSLKEQLVNSEQKLAELKETMTDTRSKWEPKLDEIVSKISDSFADNFARIGCAGQVSVDKGEDFNSDDPESGSDFDQWAIKIQVKFRESEPLSVLNAQRQSGGERAVSTIFYLMALQSLSASPFRVVDEINQGMDPRNERMVHERMVDIACGQAESGTSGGQYFLITPKLLSGLVYKPGMTVLCIFSGDYMPDDYSQLDFRQCVLRMKDFVARRGKSRPSVGESAVIG